MDRQKEFSGVGPVRQGFELDQRSLEAYMADHVEGFKGPLELKQFRGGQSNPTYLVVTQEKKYVLRKKPAGKLLKSAHAVDREYRVVTALGSTGVPVARTYALCLDDSIIGTWFYIMEYVEGRIFWSYDKVPEKDRLAVFYAMNETLARLHLVDYQKEGLGDYGKTGSYFQRQISRWSKQFEASKDQSYPAMEELIDWLASHIPDNDETTLVHGDFRLDNMVIHPTENRVLAILDWELSTLGHPLADFSYLCLPWHMPAELFSGFSGLDHRARQLPTEKEYLEAYCKYTGRNRIENWHYYMAFNFFRLAAITFGIKGRIRDGTASSKSAIAIGKMAVPLSELGVAQTKR